MDSRELQESFQKASRELLKSFKRASGLKRASRELLKSIKRASQDHQESLKRTQENSRELIREESFGESCFRSQSTRGACFFIKLLTVFCVYLLAGWGATNPPAASVQSSSRSSTYDYSFIYANAIQSAPQQPTRRNSRESQKPRSLRCSRERLNHRSVLDQGTEKKNILK